jgi:hypothetical protein
MKYYKIRLNEEQKGRWLVNPDRATNFLLLVESEIIDDKVLFKISDGERTHIPISDIGDDLHEILNTVDCLLGDCQIVGVADDCDIE